jgi:branched-chain amino acid aminotransferase
MYINCVQSRLPESSLSWGGVHAILLKKLNDGTMKIYLNGNMVDERDAVVSVLDHGFLYGDGIYETMRVYAGIVFKLEDHISRLCRSADLIGLNIPVTDLDIKNAVYETVQSNGLKEAYVRITISRGPGPIGLDPGLCKDPTMVVIAREFRHYASDLYREGVRLMVANTRRNLKEALDPRIKSLNFLNNVMAKREAIAAGAYEAIMLNHEGMLTECTVSNIFFVKDGTLCTPSVSSGILEGITRGHVISLAEKAGIPVLEDEFPLDALYKAGEVFITNTTMEVMPVNRVEHRAFLVGEQTRKLLNLYRESVPQGE